MKTERKSAEDRKFLILCTIKIIPSVTAPDATLMLVNVAASMSSWPKARRQSKELAANAIIAIAVSKTVRPAINPGSRGRTEPPLDTPRHASLSQAEDALAVDQITR
jgi:hypothetical protein